MADYIAVYGNAVSQFIPEIRLRDVTHSDETLLLGWVNDPEVRKWSWQNIGEIQASEHRQWFRNKLANENTRIWIMQSQGVPCGFVRIEIERTTAILHYSISAKHRGRNLGSRMLCLAVEKVLSEYGRLTIIAHTVPENTASHRTLEKVGFTKDTESSTDRCISYVFIGSNQVS